MADSVPRSTPGPIPPYVDIRRSKRRKRTVSAYRDARIVGLRSALAILGLMSIVALAFAGRIPTKQPGAP